MNSKEIFSDKKWYHELLYKNDEVKTNDGLSSLLDMFNNEADFIKHFIKNTLFFKKAHIIKQEHE
ncbi:hypothetical protein [Flavobacterium psychrophilum]|uniref:hypothetical protein n=1 Tax=Flavobacterium psychrophilum TaxID=96345 RepID=UPI00106ADC7D|nr:hypothetical protein [Flavobacterium psychrophilum]